MMAIDAVRGSETAAGSPVRPGTATTIGTTDAAARMSVMPRHRPGAEGVGTETGVQPGGAALQAVDDRLVRCRSVPRSPAARAPRLLQAPALQAPQEAGAQTALVLPPALRPAGADRLCSSSSGSAFARLVLRPLTSSIAGCAFSTHVACIRGPSQRLLLLMVTSSG
jgi:hypothetical protein